MNPRAPKHVLDVIQIAEPCEESWAKMKGDAQIRFCDLCEKNVYNLSAMTRDDVGALLADRDNLPCVRFYQRADGTVTTIDCAPIRFAAARALARQTMIGAASMLVSVFTLVFGLGLFRMSGIDISSWLEDTAIARIAKAVKPYSEPLMTMPGPTKDTLSYTVGPEVGVEPVEPPHRPQRPHFDDDRVVMMGSPYF